MVAIMMAVLIGCATLVVDAGFLYMTRGQLQGSVDSAALAGARAIDRSAAGLVSARARVHTYAGYHEASGSAVVIDDADITFGHWYFNTNIVCSPAPCFEELDTAGNESDINAVRVIGRRSTTTGGAIGLFFAPVLGFDTEDVTATAIAVSGGPGTDCGFPMTVAECSLDSAISSETCEYCMQFQSNNTDNAGWTSFSTDAVNPGTIASLIESACYVNGTVSIDPTTQECLGTCTTSGEGDEIRVTNGNNMNTGEGNFCGVIQDILRRGVDGATPQPFVVRIPVLDSGDSCDGTTFSGLFPVAGYATMEIQGAKCGNADPGVFAAGASCTPPASEKYVVAALRCDLESDNVVGGSYFGTQAVHIRLVD
jgi:hypothetical protein